MFTILIPLYNKINILKWDIQYWDINFMREKEDIQERNGDICKSSN